MGQFVVGDVVAINFPFSDLSGQKLRPALVLANAEFENIILCQITSKPYTSNSAIEIQPADFINESISITSYVRPDKLFTAEPTIVLKKLGSLNESSTRQVLERVRSQF